MQVYIAGCLDDSSIRLPLSSAALVYLTQYCRMEKCHINIIDTSLGSGKQDVTVRWPVSGMASLGYSFSSLQDVPDTVKMCALPVVYDVAHNMLRSGLCGTVRHIIRTSHVQNPHAALMDLLGFREGSLKACAEVSGWTNLCEVELPSSITHLIQTFRDNQSPSHLEIPVNLMKLELHMEKPPPLHNDDKQKRVLLKHIQNEVTTFTSKDNVTTCVETEAHDREFVDGFFKNRENFLPHGNIQYRVLTAEEQESRKFVNTKNNLVCKFGCTEIKLIKWCSDCNKREKLRQKQMQAERNKARLNRIENKDVLSGNPKMINCDNNKCDKNISTENVQDIHNIDELVKYTENLTLSDIALEHLYAEGVSFTVADVILFVYVYHLMESMNFEARELLHQLPYLHRWMKHLVKLSRIKETCARCEFKMADLVTCLNNKGDNNKSTVFSIPEVTLQVDEEENEISRKSKSTQKALKGDIARVLQITQDAKIVPKPGSHPRGCDIQVDWDNVPLAANPKDELPDKRVERKCQQLENLATAVEAIATPGEVIVDFCSGGGHLGIIIAYLLPQCHIYLVENKEQSLLRARTRVNNLGLRNVTLFQCNMDYFQGAFDIGVCLHACGTATDMVLQKCLEKRAAFVICPCCYGNIRNTRLVTYPCSETFKEAGLTDTDVVVLGHAADQTEVNTQCYSQGQHCMNLVDTDRAALAREQGYKVTLCALQPLTCTPKNNLLIGTPSSSHDT